MGFAEARGSVSSHTESFSGNITGLKIRDDEFDNSVYDATLYAGAGLAETSNRATHVGVKLPGVDTTCNEGASCAPLTNLRSVTVGEDSGIEGVSGFTDGFFIGFQRDGMDWQSLDGANTINAGKGVFIA